MPEFKCVTPLFIPNRLFMSNYKQAPGRLTGQPWVKGFDVLPSGSAAPYSGAVADFNSSDTAGECVSFYWVDGNNDSGIGNVREVSFECTINGMPIAGTAQFDVKKPTVDISTTTGITTIDDAFTYPDFHVHFGDVCISWCKILYYKLYWTVGIWRPKSSIMGAINKLWLSSPSIRYLHNQ